MHTYLLDDWVIGCSSVVFDAIYKLKWSLGLGRNAVIRLVIGKYPAVRVAFGREGSITAKETGDITLTCLLPHPHLT